MDIFPTVFRLYSVHDSHRKNSKRHNSVKTVGGDTVVFSAYRLMVVYICTKFDENILEGIKAIERTRFS